MQRLPPLNVPLIPSVLTQNSVHVCIAPSNLKTAMMNHGPPPKLKPGPSVATSYEGPGNKATY